MVATYEGHGIRFLYPDGWRVFEEACPPHTHCLTLQSAGTGFWMLQITESHESLERLAAEMLYSVSQEYEDVEVVPARQELAGTSLAGYDLQFFCLDFVVNAQVRSFVLGARSCALLIQAEDHEFEEMEPVFTAITTSLMAQGGRIRF